MKRKILVLFIAFAFLLAACGTPSSAPASYPQPSYPQPSSPQPSYPQPNSNTNMTPVPEAINAPQVEHPQIASLSMLTETDGWAITDQAVVRTNDGGTTWYNVSPPNAGVLGNDFGHTFLDSKHGFLVVPDSSDPMNKGTLYHTDDGGLTWTSSSIPFGQCDLHFLDLMNGWAMVSLGVGAGSNAIAVFQTTDGGTNWTRTFVDDPNVEGASTSIPLGGLKNGISALNMQTAWIGGVVYSDNTIYVYRTDDGGHNWAQINLPLPSNLESGGELGFIDLQFFNSKDAFLGLQAFGNSPKLLVFVSHDSGNSWTLTPTGIPNGKTMDFVSATDGFIYNGNQFFVTHDAGQTWMVETPSVLFGDSFATMDFVNATTGWVTSYDVSTSLITLYKTTDGGATWTAQ